MPRYEYNEIDNLENYESYRFSSIWPLTTNYVLVFCIFINYKKYRQRIQNFIIFSLIILAFYRFRFYKTCFIS